MEPTTLRYWSRALVRELGVMDKWVSETQLSPLQAHSLIELSDKPMTGLALSSVLKIDKSSVSRILQGLNQRGLIDTQSNPDDGRSILNKITTEGREVLADLEQKANL